MTPTALALTMAGTIPPLRPEPARDGYGRYVLPSPHGGREAYTRATTMVGALKDLNGLIGWKQRMTAVGLARTPHLVDVVLEVNEAIETAGADWRAAKPYKDEMALVVDQLTHAAGADRGSRAGTEAHTLSEWADAGRLDEVRHLATPEQVADLEAYLAAMDAAGIFCPVEYIERIVINTQVQTAGTFDRLVRLPDGRLVVADLKSQQNLDFGFLEMCCQLAQYANAEHMVDGDQLVPMPGLELDFDRSVGLVMHAPVGAATCALYEINLEVGWEAALTAHKVRRLRKESKSYGRPFVQSSAFAPTGADTQVLYLISHAQTRESLEAIWRDHTRRGLPWTAQMTEAARGRAAALTMEVAA